MISFKVDVAGNIYYNVMDNNRIGVFQTEVISGAVNSDYVIAGNGIIFDIGGTNIEMSLLEAMLKGFPVDMAQAGNLNLMQAQTPQVLDAINYVKSIGNTDNG